MCDMKVGQGPTNESVFLKTPSEASTAQRAGMAGIGIGIDLCEIARMQRLLDENRPLRRMFTEAEEAYIRGKGISAAQTMAGMFAAKEAVLKAFGTGLSIALTDIEIRHTNRGQPIAHLQGRAAEMGGHILLSITHEAGMAAGMAIWTK